ncbi:MAG: hypothetical protein L0227_06885 [Chloroflexi bacterium]|nr:hypothetical protein [Chloroflexota bacterium]
MPTQRFEVAVAAGGTVLNLVAGTKFEFLPVDASIMIYAVQDGGLVPAGGVTMDVSYGNVIDADAVSIPSFTAGQGPNRLDHQVSAGVARAGDRLQVKIHNGTATTSNVRTLVEYRPIV